VFIPPTTVQEITWPALPSPTAASMLAIQHQLEQSQWATEGELLNQQFEQLKVVVNYANKHVPYYKNLFKSANIKITDSLFNLENWKTIPIITRQDIQTAGKDLYSTQIPREHGKIGEISTSGSTGRTVKVAGTSITNFFWNAFTLRDHYWHQRDLLNKVATIKYLPKSLSKTISIDGWGPATDMVYKTGKMAGMSIKTSISEQVDWLAKEDPEYLLIYPSSIKAIANYAQQFNTQFKSLKEITTIGETLTPKTREFLKDVFGVPVHDIYSCQEVGYLALQCPKHEHYHIQSENVFLEILDDNNQPCKPGQVGRVVITSLHNFATPLIRYDIGDYAEVGESCDCGRGLPVIKRIMGRVRNLVTYPDGTKKWPIVGSDSYDNIAAIKQFQFIQKTVNDIDVKLVVKQPLSEEQELKLKVCMQEALNHTFNLNFSYHEDIPRSEGGKFEDFISEI